MTDVTYWRQRSRIIWLQTCLRDCAALLETIHTHETTGRRPSYSDYRGQVAATIREARNALKQGDE